MKRILYTAISFVTLETALPAGAQDAGMTSAEELSSLYPGTTLIHQS